MLDLLADRRRLQHRPPGESRASGTAIIRSDRSLTLSEDPPITIAAIDTQDVITDLLPAAVDLMKKALSRWNGRGWSAMHMRRSCLRIMTSSSRSHRAPQADRGLACLLRGVRSAAPSPLRGRSVLLGVDRTADGHRRRAKFFGRNSEVPLMIIAIGTVAQVERAPRTRVTGLQPHDHR